MEIKNGAETGGGEAGKGADKGGDKGGELASKIADKADGLIARRRNEFVMAKYRLSVQASRLFMYVLSKVTDEDDESTTYTFSINELADAIGVARANLYRDMVEVIRELEVCSVDVAVPDEEGKPKKDEFVRVGLIVNKQKVKLGAGERPLISGEISISLHKELLPYVQRLKERYTAIELKYFFRLTSSYSQKLYDLLKARAFMHQAWRVERDELRALLGIGAKEYTLWGDFRRFVLLKAQTDIAAHTDLSFDVEYIKTGQVVTELVFRLRKEGGSDVEVLPGTDKHKAFKWMVELGLSAKDADKVLHEWWDVDAERVLWHAGEARRLKSNGKIDNPVGWFRSGLKKDFRPNRSLFADMRKDAAAKRTEYERSVGESKGFNQLPEEVRVALREIGSYDGERKE